MKQAEEGWPDVVNSEDGENVFEATIYKTDAQLSCM